MRDVDRAVLLPSFNSGPLLQVTAEEALRFWPRVVVVLDGSTDNSVQDIEKLALRRQGLEVHRLPQNMGKGAAVLEGMRRSNSTSHVLVMDADGQHPAERIPDFFDASRQCPRALIAGEPIFGPDAPRERVLGRLVGNTLAQIETLGRGPRDSLFGFRVYPVKATMSALEGISWGRRYDFDTVAAVRLAWQGVPVINLPARVTYLALSEGGVTHFRYIRDNALLARAHTRLLLGFLARCPCWIARRLRGEPQPLGMLANAEADGGGRMSGGITGSPSGSRGPIQTGP